MALDHLARPPDCNPFPRRLSQIIFLPQNEGKPVNAPRLQKFQTVACRPRQAITFGSLNRQRRVSTHPAHRSNFGPRLRLLAAPISRPRFLRRWACRWGNPDLHSAGLTDARMGQRRPLLKRVSKTVGCRCIPRVDELAELFLCIPASPYIPLAFANMSNINVAGSGTAVSVTSPVV